MRRRAGRLGVVVAVGMAALSVCAEALASGAPPAPAPLSATPTRVAIASSHGSGAFGSWGVDGFGLPRYRYTLDEETAPQAAQPELAGDRAAWSQVGNDRVVADAYNHGYLQLWSQDRTYQWVNSYRPQADHFAGGYGYVELAGRTWSTLYLDRRAGETVRRSFGTGYAETDVGIPGLRIRAIVYGPFGNDPLLLHDVTLTNVSRSVQRPTWSEYWDVDPVAPSTGTTATLSMTAPRYDAAAETLSDAELATAENPHPLTVFAAALRGPVAGFDTDTEAFFGSGSRARPAAVAADASHGSIAPASSGGAQAGRAMFAFRSPVTLRPGHSVTLRYAYGYDDEPAAIAPLIARYRAAASPLQASERQWRAYVPQIDLGGRYRWLSRELEWDAYMLRSDATYEACAGEHILSQGGYYQYAFGWQSAYRDPLQLMLPLIYEDPALARQVIVYSAQEQSQGSNAIPYGQLSGCKPQRLGTSDDLDLWLLLAAEQYGLGTRDVSFFNTQARWANGGRASLWSHLEQAFTHQESLHGAHGDYVSGTLGDWSDLSTSFLQMTESSLVTAQAAYIYPRTAELADLDGRRAFAARLRAAGAMDARTVAGEWVGHGWYARGWSGATRLGVGAIFEEPQPWAILAGIPSSGRARTLVANIHRFLDGDGAPGGPTKIGTAESPAADDPLVTEHSPVPGDGAAVFVGGVWYSLNGWLTWALGTLDGEVPGARADAFGELVRNTLADHATAFPDSWDGILSVDDVCDAWYSPSTSACGAGLTTAYDTQIPHQDAWLLWDVLQLAGVSPTTSGFRIQPHLAMANFSVRFQGVGVASAPGVLRGYVRPQASGGLSMEVAPPPDTGHRRLWVFVGRHQVLARLIGGLVRFRLAVTAGHAADWAVVAGTRNHGNGGTS
jgi:Glycosyl hydrolase 36 superfamily, catalytic domain/Glycosyltransferase family 36